MDYLAPPKPNNLWGRSLQGADIVDAVLSPCLYSIICATVSLALSRPFLCPAGAMALSSSIRISLIVAFFGLLAFILGVIAENKKVRPFPCCERWSLTFFPSRGWWILHNTKHYCYYEFPLNMLANLYRLCCSLLLGLLSKERMLSSASFQVIRLLRWEACPLWRSW